MSRLERYMVDGVLDAAAMLADPHVAEAIDKRVAATGRPRELYEAYLAAPLDPHHWEDQLHGRWLSITAGPLPPSRAQEIRRMVTPPGGATEAA